LYNLSAKAGAVSAYFALSISTGADPITATFSSWLGLADIAGVISATGAWRKA
jgi:hypothetical protein